MSTPEPEQLARETAEQIWQRGNAESFILAALQRAVAQKDKAAELLDNDWRLYADKLTAQLAEYRNLKGQGWYHPDIVNGLRAQLAAAKERAERAEEELNNLQQGYERT